MDKNNFLLKSMTPKEYNEMLQYAIENNSFHSKTGARIPTVKYIEHIFDARTLEVWSVTFRGYGGYTLTFRMNQFAGHPRPKNFKYESIKDLIMDYLDDKLADEIKLLFIVRDN